MEKSYIKTEQSTAPPSGSIQPIKKFMIKKATINNTQNIKEYINKLI